MSVRPFYESWRDWPCWKSVNMMWCFCCFVLVSFPVGEDEEEFENFMLPLTVSFESVARIFNSSFEQEEAKVGLFQ